MGNFDFSNNVETPPNYEQKTVCCFVLDNSLSMDREPIDELNKGLQHFYEEIRKDSVLCNRLEVAVVTFNDQIHIAQQPSLAEEILFQELSVGGNTRLVDGVREGIRVVRDRKQWYRDTGQDYLRPWIILITDGKPNTDQDVKGLAEEIQIQTKAKEFIFMPIGVKEADMATLNEIAGYINDGEKWNKMTPMKIKGLNFTEFFRWVSSSLSEILNSQPGDRVGFADPQEWMAGYTVS